ncbi:tripartite motif-containing protein 2-like [Haliotis asinina]|uniref:tripartite motif-containing protein 2-like n=1 Tax=Haliotis asinina TaxID=109174 RepID=UPI00353267AC
MAHSKAVGGHQTLAELVQSDFLHCDVCQHQYHQPVLLPCLHSFCVSCVSHLAADSRRNANSLLQLTCPTCKSTVTLSDISINQPNMFLLNLCQLWKLKAANSPLCEYCAFNGENISASTLCLDCQDNMCTPCTQAHQRTRVTRDHKLALHEQIRKGLYDHDIRNHQHIMCSVHKESHQNMMCESCIKLICQDCALEGHVDHNVSSVEAVLPKYKKQLMSFTQGLKTQITTIQDYVTFLDTHEADIHKKKKETSELITNQANLLHKLIDQQRQQLLDKLNVACQEEVKKLQAKCKDLKVAEISIQQNTIFLDFLQRFGTPDETILLYKPVAERLNQLRHMKPDRLSHRLMTQFTLGSSTEMNVQIMFGHLNISRVPFDQENSQQPHLVVSRLMPHILPTPQLMAVFDVKVDTDSVDAWPTGLSVTQEGFVIVDRDNKKVKIFDKDGKLKRQFSGKGDHELSSPFDVTILPNSNIAVTDYKDEDVKIYDQSGNCVVAITGHCRHPRGITTNRNGQIIVVDCHLHQIMTFHQSSGELLSTIKAVDNNGGQLLIDPYYITVTDSGNMVITDQATPNLKILNSKGEILSQYGTYGTHQNQILQPYGVCIDSNGYIFLADHQNSRIHLLLPDGRFLKFFLTKQDKLWHPVAIDCDSNGHLVVAEALGKIKIFKYI